MVVSVNCDNLECIIMSLKCGCDMPETLLSQ
jgi:hypothetical protein